MSASPSEPRAASQAPASESARARSPGGEALKRLFRNRMAMVSFGFIVVLAIIGFMSPFWERNVTHFSPTEQHNLLQNQPPGARDISTWHPTYDGDKRAFALVDFDGDGQLRCHIRRAPPVLPPGFRDLQRLAPSLYAEAKAGFDAADADHVLSDALSLMLGALECPELQLAQDVATGFFDKLPTNRWDVARGDDEPVPGKNDADGFITWREYPHDDLALPEELRGLGLSGPETFRRLDVDGDHVLSRWEILETSRYLRYSSVGKDGLSNNFDAFVRSYDQDGDLSVSLAEFPGAPELHTFAFGTDGDGQDVLTRLLYGARLSIMIGLLATLVSLVIGVVYGATAGYLGGRIDNVMMRFVDVLYGLPYMFIVILLFVIIHDPNNVVLLFVALGAVQWLTMARVVRGQVLSLKNREFIEAARAIGASQPRIILRHLIPNAIGPVIVYATLLVPQAILQEAFLSFLGLGVDMSWGRMIADGADWTKMQSVPWVLVFPGVALALTLFALNFLGDGVRDAMDPSLKGR
ncbi:MAG: ABC transporter permease subunit [Myxococcota bacterium]